VADRMTREAGLHFGRMLRDIRYESCARRSDVP
jgi:hypothetical protein